MATVFSDQKGVLLVKLLQLEITINVAGYCETLKWLRRRAT